jgi:hypothetical protein
MDLLSFFALGIIVFVFLTRAYGIVAIHDIPYNMPKRAITRIKMPSMQRGWVSLVYSACHLAIFVDMGNGLSAGPRLRVFQLSAGQLSADPDRCG